MNTKLSVAVVISAMFLGGCIVVPGPAYSGSNFGTVALSTGFMPDPHVVTGRSGGGQPAESVISSTCRGHITPQPDHQFVAQTGFSFLRIMASSAGDTTLIIQAPDGSFLCDDDSGSNLNPRVEGSFAPGTYNVWIGSFGQGEYHDYRLGFTEMQHITDANF